MQTVYGLDDDFEEQVLDVIHADAEVRALLQLGPRSQVVRIQGLTRDKAGVPLDRFGDSNGHVADLFEPVSL